MVSKVIKIHAFYNLKNIFGETLLFQILSAKISGVLIYVKVW